MPSADVQEIQAAIDDAIAAGNPPFVYLDDNRDYDIDDTISFRGWFENSGIIGRGLGTRLVSSMSDDTLPMVEVRASTRVQFRDFTYVGGSATGVGVPACGLLAGRTSVSSAGGHLLDRVRFEGRFRAAAYLCVASEGNVCRDCYFSNDEGPSKTFNGLAHGGHLIAFYNGDDHDWTSLPLHEQTMLTAQFENCRFVNTGDTGSWSILIYGKPGATITDFFFETCRGKSIGAAGAFLINAPNAAGTVRRISIATSYFDESESDDFFKVVCSAPRGIANITIRESTILCGAQAGDLGELSANVHIDDVVIRRTTPDFTTPAIIGTTNLGGNLFERVHLSNLYQVGPTSWGYGPVPMSLPTTLNERLQGRRSRGTRLAGRAVGV